MEDAVLFYVREAREDEYEEIRKLWHDTFGAFCPEDEEIADGIKHGGVIAAVNENEEILGAANIFYVNAVRRAKLDILVVKKEFRRRGCASALLNYFRERFSAYSQWVRSYKIDGEDKAEKLFLKLGMKISEDDIWAEGVYEYAGRECELFQNGTKYSLISYTWE